MYCIWSIEEPCDLLVMRLQKSNNLGNGNLPSKTRGITKDEALNSCYLVVSTGRTPRIK